ncbi:MAG: heparan N-sulfatase, partial [Planctomycetota bacterium]|nr:heparan N-sulfatase [Planctomycetota bacterium]
ADAVTSPTFQEMRRLRDLGALSEAQAALFAAPRPAEELYDVEADPHAVRNLAADPNYTTTLTKMRAAVDAWRIETGDEFTPSKLTADRFDRNTGKPLRSSK